MKSHFLLAACLVTWIAARDVSQVKTVHIVFMNHLDVGFDGINPIIGYAINVINMYFDVYFPRAVATAQALRERGGPERLIYTTHPWLVTYYLNCKPDAVPNVGDISLHCPNDTTLAAFKKAINQGDITWHAYPFNAEAELVDASLFQFGISMAHDLDKQFGKNITATMSQRDVPGTTRSIISTLVLNGVNALSVGVNGASAPPDVPNPSVWTDENGVSVLLMYHPGGYGGLDISDCVIVDGFPDALCFAFRGDNAGPPEPPEVIQNFQQVQQEFPNAVVKASTFDEFTSRLQTIKDQLPVVTQEIGDTWIHGVQSDPLKVAQLRSILRLRQQCILSGKCTDTDPNFLKFNRLLIKAHEHTWGLDVKTFLGDWSNWSNKQFQKVKNGPKYQLMVNSWIEQRNYIYQAIKELGATDFAKQILASFEELKPKRPSTAGYSKIINYHHKTFQCNSRFSVGFDHTGAFSHLVDSVTGLHWASSCNPLGQFVYTTFNAKDYNTFLNEYMYCPTSVCTWAGKDFGKPNVSEAFPQHQKVTPLLRSLYKAHSNNGTCNFLLELTMPSLTVTHYGAPKTIWVKVAVADQIDVDLMLFDKTTTKLPEALWFSFNPKLIRTGEWIMDKMGQPVSPSDVAFNGSKHLHAVESGVYYVNNTGDGVYSRLQPLLAIQSVDAALVSVGSHNPFPTPLIEPDLTKGMHFNLYNNIWGTNYIMWYPYLQGDQDLLFRFSLNFEVPS